MRFNLIVRLVIASIMALFLIACASSPTNKIAAKWPKITPELQQAKALAASQKALQEITEPDVLLQFSQQDVSEFLLPSLSKKLSELEIDNIQRVTVSNLQLNFDKQLMRINGDFDLHLEEPNFIIKGHIRGLVAVALQDEALQFYPMLDTLKLEEVDHSEIKIRWADFKHPKQLWEKLKTKYGNKLAAKVVNATFKNFMGAINTIAFRDAIDWKIDTDILPQKTLNDMLKPGKTDKVTYSVTGSNKTIAPRLFLGQAVVYINDDTLSLMVDINDGPAGAELGVDRLLQAEGKPASFAEDFATFRDRYKAQRQHWFTSSSSSSQILIRKKAIADTLNSAIHSIKDDEDSPLLMVIATHQPLEDSFADKVQLFKKDQVDCEKKRKSCKSTRSCANTTNCGNVRSCAGNCSRFDLICKTKAEACRVSARAEAEACRVGARLKAESCRNEERIKAEACRVAQDLEVANCKVKLEALRVVEDFLDVAEYSVHAEVSNIEGVSTLYDLSISEDMQKVTVKGDVQVSAAVNASVRINPEGIGHLACIWKQNPELSMVASASQPLEVTGSITADAAAQSDNLGIHLQVSSNPVMIQTSPNPWTTLSTDPGFMLNCSVLSIAMQTARIVDFIKLDTFPADFANAMSGRYEYESLDFDMTQEIAPLKITIAGESIRFMPHWNEGVIGFSR